MEPLAPIVTTGFLLIASIIIFWDLAWKGVALWMAAQRQEKAWFVCLLVLNTVGILPILYIFLFAKNAHKS